MKIPYVRAFHEVISICFRQENLSDLEKLELNHFYDACTDGYGQCSYLRLVDKHGQINCTLLIGKAQVAPLKPLMIPRLKLTVAVVSVKVKLLSRELSLQNANEVFWTDSKVVPAPISNDAGRFHMFVVNRVQQI